VGYWVEEVDLNGTHSMVGPAYPEPPADLSSAALSRLVAEAEGNTGLKTGMLSAVGRVSEGLPATGVSPSCGPVNSGSQPFQRIGTQPPITPETQRKQFALAAGPAIKISVRAEGWYRITQPQLLAAGLAPDADPRFLRLYANAVEQPIIVHEHEKGNLHAQDDVKFYGYRINTTWSGTQVYWLVVGSTEGSAWRSSRYMLMPNRGRLAFRRQWCGRRVLFTLRRCWMAMPTIFSVP
jgi:hypothetical protein